MSEVGTGLQDFAQAFRSAGAKTVIAPIMRIDDEAALFLATQFYKHWSDGLSKPQALRAAQLDLRRARPPWQHPYFWAFYRLIGAE
jgi:CHAT domain-containing protein